jgi:hypothetical protein
MPPLGGRGVRKLVRRIVGTFLVAGILLLVTAGPVMAYLLYGWFSTAAIDTDLNGQADLSVCYDSTGGGTLHINRAQVEEEIDQWHTAAVGWFSSNGVCNADGSNIEMLWLNLGFCEPGNGSYARTEDKGNAGYTSIRIWFNTQCIDDFDWYDTDGIDTGYVSALAVALHEMGHAIGMNHSSVANAVLNAGGPDNCSIVGNDLTLAYDDADGYRDRYAGIADTSTFFPPSAGCIP